MGHMQRGHIYEASGWFFVRDCVTGIVNGEPKRVQRSHRLCRVLCESTHPRLVQTPRSVLHAGRLRSLAAFRPSSMPGGLVVSRFVRQYHLRMVLA